MVRAMLTAEEIEIKGTLCLPESARRDIALNQRHQVRRILAGHGVDHGAQSKRVCRQSQTLDDK